MNGVPDHIAMTQYPTVRLASRNGAIALTDERLRMQLQEMFPDAEPEDVENFMRTLRKIGKQLEPIGRQILPVLAKAAPGAIQGAMTGMAAGPYGALAGAGIGAVASVLSSPPRQSSRAPQTAAPARAAPIPRAPVSRSPARAASPAPMPSRSRATPGRALPQAGQTAVAQLLALLSRPETLQALSALMMGQRGRQQVRVGQAQVPVAAFANAIAEFAGAAADACAPCAAADRHLAQLQDAQIDIANPAARAQALLQLLLNGAPQ